MMNSVESSDKGSRWVWMPIGLLLASTLGVGSLAAIAVHDPSFALEPNYYDKALHWDRTQEQAADNQRLGYQIELVPRIAVDASGNATVQVHIADASGREPNAATVRATAFANAYSGERAPLDFRRVAPGLYSASLSARHLGLWEFRFVVTQGSDRVTSTLRSDIVQGAG